MILVHVKSISVTDMGFIVFLKNKNDKRLFPIFIGSLESKAISSVLMGEHPKRPLTHDLLKKILHIFNVKVQRIVIDSLHGSTLCSKIYLENKNILRKKIPEKKITIDARPSDAIAIALRFKAGIFVNEHVFDQCAVAIKNIEEPLKNDVMGSSEHEGTPSTSRLEIANKQIEGFKKSLREAIQSERFEEAAQIRDKIANLITQFNDN